MYMNNYLLLLIIIIHYFSQHNVEVAVIRPPPRRKTVTRFRKRILLDNTWKAFDKHIFRQYLKNISKYIDLGGIGSRVRVGGVGIVFSITKIIKYIEKKNLSNIIKNDLQNCFWDHQYFKIVAKSEINVLSVSTKHIKNRTFKQNSVLCWFVWYYLYRWGQHSLN